MIYWQMKLNKKYLFWILFVVMAVYYGYRMFVLTPWYDELYTYYYFISKGSLYAAIHWPLPNNHVGYSVLSAFLDFFGNSYIGLRGVSYLSALANMYLLYRIAGKYMKEQMALGTVILYVSMNLVNQLAVQGRGYTLGITCFLTAWLCMIQICTLKQAGKKYYVIYAAALILGLYTVSSNVYWVVPLCLAGGCYLLICGMSESRENTCPVRKTESIRRLFQLVLASLAAAIGTVLLYMSIWVSIGSNLLVKDEAGIYYGMGHVQMILKAPFEAIRKGMEYMLETPYIQSEERAGFVGRLFEWIVTLTGYYFNSLSLVMMLVWVLGIAFSIYRLVREIQQENSQKMLLYLVLLLEIVLVPVILLIQCKRPYYRVFTYGGILLAMLLGIFMENGVELIQSRFLKGKSVNGVYTALLLALTLFGVKCIGFSDYNNQYGLNEYEIQDAFAHGNMEAQENLCVTDCNQEYLLYFLYHIRCENREIEGADVVLLDKRMTDPEFDEMVWEFYVYYDSIPWDYLEQNMKPSYENENYILYTRN